MILGPSSQVKKKQQSWKEKVIFKCLMYMGDLTRYQLEFVSVEEGQNLAKIAKKYYLEALSVDQNQGQPFNQLAALSGRNHLRFETLLPHSKLWLLIKNDL